MKAANIVQQLKTTLPLYTNLFSDILSVTSLTSSGLIVTASTGTIPHGLVTGDEVIISGALTPISISSLTQTNNVATAITVSPHDFTDNYTTTVNIVGADQLEYNGVHPFIHQANRLTFEYSITGNPVSPATGTDIYVLENAKYGYNGTHIITVIDDYTFTYPITSTPGSPAQGTITLSSNHRISDVISVDRAKESYTPQANGKLWLFVVLGSTNSSKDRFVYSDATSMIVPGQDYRQRVIDNISFYIFVPCPDETSAAIVRDLMQDLFSPILKSIGRFHPPTIFTDKTNFGMTFVGHDFYEYNYAYYIHQYAFESIYDLTYPDTIDTDNSVAFRDVEIDYINNMDVIIMQTDVDLDDEPLP